MDNFSVSGKNRNIFVRILHFYVEGFRNMTVGKTLWIIILIKLFVMFVVLKMLFFPDFARFCLLFLNCFAIFQVYSSIIGSWVFLNIFLSSFGRFILVLSL